MSELLRICQVFCINVSWINMLFWVDMKLSWNYIQINKFEYVMWYTQWHTFQGEENLKKNQFSLLESFFFCVLNYKVDKMTVRKNKWYV